jgi:hypothetical protein
MAAAEPVPAALRRAVLETHGLDLGPMPIRRDQEADHLTALHGARALTRGGEVFLPADHGPLDRPPAAGLLAHELTHVVQQRRLGDHVPPEDSPAGRALEAEARTAGHLWAERDELPAPGQDGLPPPLPTAAPAVVVVPDADGFLAALAAAGISVEHEQTAPAPPPAAMAVAPPPMPPPPSAPVQRLNDGSSPPEPPSSTESTVTDETPDVSTTPSPPSTTDPVGDVERDGATTPSVPEQPAPVAAPSLDLDLLAHQLYGRIRTRLRSELLIDRERSGMLADR